MINNPSRISMALGGRLQPLKKMNTKGLACRGVGLTTLSMSCVNWLEILCGSFTPLKT